MRWCTNLLKTVPREKFLSELRKNYDVIEYIGIAADETERITHKCNSRPNVWLPLVEWGMTEADCLKYCKERGYDWGGLYEKFGRVSCWCCPLQPLNELRVLYYAIFPTSGNNSGNGMMQHGAPSSPTGQSGNWRLVLILSWNGRRTEISSTPRNSARR